MFIELDGPGNFRDAGGRLTTSGRKVRSGVLYRSNNLAGLTAADRASLTALGVRRVYDLREPEEATRAPTFLPGVEIITSGANADIATWTDLLKTYPKSPAGMREFLGEFYAVLPGILARDIAAIVRDMIADCAPCIIHCSAGKDRTGVVIALLLALLEVSAAEIVAEYRLTEGRIGLAEDQQRAFGTSRPDSALSGLDAESWAAMLSVEDRFLQAAFEAVHRQYGSIQHYAHDALGIDQAALAAFREALREPQAMLSVTSSAPLIPGKPGTS